jgi:hypothetical protein
MQTILLILHRREPTAEPAPLPRAEGEPPFWTWFIENAPPASWNETPIPSIDDPDRH